MAQASRCVTITADSYPTTREGEVPKGQLFYSGTAQTLGTILVHNAEWHHPRRNIAPGTVVSLGSRKHGKELGLREQASGKQKKNKKSTAQEPLQAGERGDGGAATSDTLKACEVNDGLDEDGVISDVGVLGVQFGERAEERAAAGNVHVTHRPLKGRRGNVWPEGIDDVLPVVLIQQHEGDLRNQGIG